MEKGEQERGGERWGGMETRGEGRGGKERRKEERRRITHFSKSAKSKCTYFEPSVWPAEPFSRKDQVGIKLKKLFQEFLGICK